MSVIRIWRKESGWLTVSFVAVLALFLVSWVMGIVSVQVIRSGVQAVVEKQDVLASHVDGIGRTMNDQESDLRGFFLTGNQEFLTLYSAAGRALPSELHVATLDVHASDEAHLMHRLALAATAWEVWARRELSLWFAGEHTRIRTAVDALTGKRLLDRFRSTTDALQGLLERERRSELANSDSTYTLTLILRTIITLLAIVEVATLAHRTIRMFHREQGARNVLESAESALRESEHRFKAMFDQAGIGVAQSDLDGRWLLVNQRLLDLYQYSQEELFTMRFQEITHPDDVADDEAQYARLLSGEIDKYTLEKRYIRKDATLVWANLTVSLVRDLSGTPRYTMGLVEDITARKEAEQALKHQALHDALTGLPNRTLMLDRLDQAARIARREGAATALLLMDLDHFKEVNDTFGHHCGDMLLQQLRPRLQSVLRESDTVARLGGDEIAVILPNTDANAAIHVAEKLLHGLRQSFVVDGHVLEVSASIGIAVFPEHGEDAATLLRRADVAMYAAKRARAGWRTYDPGTDRHSPMRVALVSELRKAVEARQLFLHYQPKIDLETEHLRGVEALARWTHPQHGSISPEQFVPLAEETGLIRALTHWALETALTERRAWVARGLDVNVAVNLSPRILQDRSIVDTIAALLKAVETQPDRLTLEITEGAVMADPERTLEILSRLHELGVRISIDDFGTGYSSLGYLKRLPVTQVKIDRSFVTDMTLRADDTSIVQSVIDLGHNLGLEVVAEGIETWATWDALGRMGCDSAQGFFICHPLSGADLLVWNDHRNEPRLRNVKAM